VKDNINKDMKSNSAKQVTVVAREEGSSTGATSKEHQWGRKRQMRLLPLLVAALLLLVLSFLAWNLRSRIVEDKIELLRITSAIGFEADKSKNAGSVIDLVRGEEKAIEELGSYFVNATNVVPSVETIEELGRSLPISMSISSISLSAKQDALTLRLMARGAFPELVRLLALLERLPYRTRIGPTQIVVSKGQERGDVFSSNFGAIEQEEVPQWQLDVTVNIDSVIASRE